MQKQMQAMMAQMQQMMAGNQVVTAKRGRKKAEAEKAEVIPAE